MNRDFKRKRRHKYLMNLKYHIKKAKKYNETNDRNPDLVKKHILLLQTIYDWGKSVNHDKFYDMIILGNSMKRGDIQAYEDILYNEDRMQRIVDRYFPDALKRDFVIDILLAD